jgi:hypothetical protein
MVARRAKPGLAQAPLNGTDIRRLIDGKMLERDWQKVVESALDAFGWWFAHVPANVVMCPRCKTKVYRGIRKGIPDILAIKPPYILWLELKTEHGRLETEQREVGDMLQACGQTFVEARPRDRAALLDLIAHPEQRVMNAT